MVAVSDQTDEQDFFVDPFEEEEGVDDQVTRRRLGWGWRVAGIVTALAMLVLPLWNVVQATSPQVADNGLEVCAFDYCIVEEQVREAGYAEVMIRQSGEIVPDREVQSYVDAFTDVVGGPPLTAEVVDDLPGELGGRYTPADRHIQIDRPATVWIIAHEVAHSVGSGHDDDFIQALLELAAHLEVTASP